MSDEEAGERRPEVQQRTRPLANRQWEEFSRLKAMGRKHSDAYDGAGYETKGRKQSAQSGGRLFARLEIKARVAEIEEELRNNSLARAEMDREFVMVELRENIERCKQASPVLGRDGQETGEYKFEPNALNKSLHLAGLELGMFSQTLHLDNLDHELEGMNGEQLRAYVRMVASDVGLRVVDMNKDELRDFILRNAESVGLRFAAGSEGTDGAETPQDRELSSVPEAGAVPRARPH